MKYTKNESYLEKLTEIYERHIQQYSDSYILNEIFWDEERYSFILWRLESQIINGGFHQYFWNYWFAAVSIVQEALRYFEIDESIVRIFDQAYVLAKENTLYSEHLSHPEWDDDLDIFIKGYQNNPLNTLDDRFILS
jgi:Domain of unknown function (DUF4375)